MSSEDVTQHPIVTSCLVGAARLGRKLADAKAACAAPDNHGFRTQRWRELQEAIVDAGRHCSDHKWRLFLGLSPTRGVRSITPAEDNIARGALEELGLAVDDAMDYCVHSLWVALLQQWPAEGAQLPAWVDLETTRLLMGWGSRYSPRTSELLGVDSEWFMCVVDAHFEWTERGMTPIDLEELVKKQSEGSLDEHEVRALAEYREDMKTLAADLDKLRDAELEALKELGARPEILEGAIARSTPASATHGAAGGAGTSSA